jgi:GNAT superfamily N-acetyltransferase
MTLPDAPRLYKAIEATWPAARRFESDGWVLRDGQGGGSRVSSATLLNPDAGTLAGVQKMAAAQAGMGQQARVMVRVGDDALDRTLEGAGYRIADKTLLYAAPVGKLAIQPPAVSSFITEWPALGILQEIWRAGGIGPERIAVMDRVKSPKCAILGRIADQPAAAAFLAVDGDVAMLHALEVLTDKRRKNMAIYVMQAAALWAHDQGADILSVAVTQANTGANALYASLGMTVVGRYHYRFLP